MNEATLKRALMPALRAAMPGAVIWRIEDKFTAGRPDILVIWRGKVAGVEVKLDRPGRAGARTELQKLTLRRLEAAGALAVWLVYWPDKMAVYERWDTNAIQVLGDGKRWPHAEIAAWLAKRLETR